MMRTYLFVRPCERPGSEYSWAAIQQVESFSVAWKRCQRHNSDFHVQYKWCFQFEEPRFTPTLKEVNTLMEDFSDQLFDPETVWIRPESEWMNQRVYLDNCYAQHKAKQGLVPQLPVEVWNPRKVDTAAAWKAVLDLCKGI